MGRTLFNILGSGCILAIILAACGDSDSDSKNNTIVFSAGDKQTFTADGVSFMMAYVPGGISFPTEVDDLGTPATVAAAYWIGETEVTWALWRKVHDWAIHPDRGTKGYAFKYPGRMGSVADGTGMTDQHPVTCINWRDAMVWCNALTEWYNAHRGTSHQCVYTHDGAVIRDSRDSNDTACDNVVAGVAAGGFRLPASDEWELAARWRNDAVNTVTGYTNPYFTKGNSASGATASISDESATREAARSWGDPGGNHTGAVKGKKANALGLFDMSGNVLEWCFDLNGSMRVYRGASWNDSHTDTCIGLWHSYTSYDEFDYQGFRLVRSD